MLLMLPMKIQYGLIMVPVAVLIMAGCATVPPRSAGHEISIVLQGQDRITMDNRQMTAEQIAGRLRSQSLATDTLIKIERGAGATEQAMALLVATLQEAGYTRVVFVRPRQIEVDVP